MTPNILGDADEDRNSHISFERVGSRIPLGVLINFRVSRSGEIETGLEELKAEVGSSVVS